MEGQSEVWTRKACGVSVSNIVLGLCCQKCPEGPGHWILLRPSEVGGGGVVVREEERESVRVCACVCVCACARRGRVEARTCNSKFKRITDFFRGMHPVEALIPHYVTNFSVAAGLPSRPKWRGCEGRVRGAHFH